MENDKATTTIGPTITSVQPATQALRVIVVGAGGTGGRLIPPLMQVLKRGDSVAIVDGDHVEDRNLARQNFKVRDVGENKAEVMARRYRRDGIEVDAYAAMLTVENWREVLGSRGSERYIWLGCVDNWRARKLLYGTIMPSVSALWIDAGNEMRGGQVLMSATQWPFRVKAEYLGKPREAPMNCSLRGMDAMPQLLVPQPWHCDRCNIDNKAEAATCKGCNLPEASCRDRIDLQTVAVNQLSASCMLNMLSCILYGHAIMTCGAFFSTLNVVTPIKLESMSWDHGTLYPEATYAEK